MCYFFLPPLHPPQKNLELNFLFHWTLSRCSPYPWREGIRDGLSSVFAHWSEIRKTSWSLHEVWGVRLQILSGTHPFFTTFLHLNFTPYLGWRICSLLLVYGKTKQMVSVCGTGVHIRKLSPYLTPSQPYWPRSSRKENTYLAILHTFTFICMHLGTYWGEAHAFPFLKLHYSKTSERVVWR